MVLEMISDSTMEENILMTNSVILKTKSTMLWNLLDTTTPMKKDPTGLLKLLSEPTGEIMDKCGLKKLLKDLELVNSKLELLSLVTTVDYFCYY